MDGHLVSKPCIQPPESGDSVIVVDNRTDPGSWESGTYGGDRKPANLEILERVASAPGSGTLTCSSADIADRAAMAALFEVGGRCM